jgi:hypothetical protein
MRRNSRASLARGDFYRRGRRGDVALRWLVAGLACAMVLVGIQICWADERTPLKPGWNLFTPEQDIRIGQQASASWIRNDGPGGLAPDWERIGTDVTHQGPFNASFSLSGETIPAVPEPSTLLLLGTGVSMLVGWRRKQHGPR